MVKWYCKYGKKASRIVIRYGQYGRKVSWIVKRCKKFGIKVFEMWNDMDNMEERQVEEW